jgi:hypothetical protein
MRPFVVVTVAAVLAACVFDEERAAAVASSDDSQCQSYGAQPGSDRYFQCRMMLNQQRQANDAAIVGASLNRPQPAPFVPSDALRFANAAHLLSPAPVQVIL